MEEVATSLVDTSDIGDFCTKMYRKVGQKNPVTGLFNGVRVIMFEEG